MIQKWHSLVVFSIMILIIISGMFPVVADGSSTEIQVLPQTQNVSPGENFTVNINITPVQPIRGVEFKLSFNPSLLHAGSVTEGNLFDGYNTLFNGGIIDNENGVITQVYSTILGEGNISTPGTFATIGFTAIQTGNSPLHLFDIRITNETDYVTVTINDGVVKIIIAGNNPPMFSSETPSNGATNVPVSTSLLEIIIEDPEGDEFSWSIETSPDVGSSNGAGDNGTKTCSVSNLKYDTTYTWYINASDTGSGGWVNETYSFTTESSSNGDGNSNGGTPPANTPPVANVSGSEILGFIGTYIHFNGSLSHDPDGDIVSWNWDFNDGEKGDGETIEHIFFGEGVFNVTLTVTDNLGATDTDTVSVSVVKGNNLPTTPEVTGPTAGHKNTVYEYMVNATDEDNDTISFIFDWGDKETTTTDYIPVGIIVAQNHTWTAAGRYTLEVQATDNETYSRTAELIVMIDAIDVGDIGYFTDDDSDETYDTFHSDSDDVETVLGVDDDGKYLIDNTGDDKWNYVYDLDTGELVEYIYEGDAGEDGKNTPSLGIIITIFAVAFFFLLKKKHPPKKSV